MHGYLRQFLQTASLQAALGRDADQMCSTTPGTQVGSGLGIPGQAHVSTQAGGSCQGGHGLAAWIPQLTVHPTASASPSTCRSEIPIITGFPAAPLQHVPCNIPIAQGAQCPGQHGGRGRGLPRSLRNFPVCILQSGPKPSPKHTLPGATMSASEGHDL